MTMNHAQKVAETLSKNADLLLRVARFLVSEGLLSEDSFELAETVCIATFGQRVTCPECRSEVFPGFLCWGCEDWTAEEVAT